MMERKGIQIIGIVLMLLVVGAIGGEIYLGYTLKKENSALREVIEKTQADLQVTQSTFNTMQEEQQRKLESIADALKKVDKESKSRLSDLEEEVKNVNIKSGDFSAILEDVFPGVVSIATDVGRGSGTIITND